MHLDAKIRFPRVQRRYAQIIRIPSTVNVALAYSAKTRTKRGIKSSYTMFCEIILRKRLMQPIQLKPFNIHIHTGFENSFPIGIFFRSSDEQLFVNLDKKALKFVGCLPKLKIQKYRSKCYRLSDPVVAKNQLFQCRKSYVDPQTSFRICSTAARVSNPFLMRKRQVNTSKKL